MPKRWERDLRRLGDVPAPIDDIRARSVRPSDGHTPSTSLPPTRQRVVAGIVAFGVFIAAGTFLVRAIDPTGAERPVEVGKAPLPSFRVVFTTTSAGLIGLSDSPREVEISTEYGDIRDVSVTSTSPRDDPYASHAKELQPLFPSPTVGSPVSLETDGYNPRIMVVKASDWPDLSRHSGVDRLPTDPGRYVMIFQAEYPEGVAMIARTVDLVAPGTVQIAATEGGGVGNASATFVVDGAAVPGILRESSFHHSDAVGLLPGERPPGDPTFIDVSLRANIVLGEGPTDRRLRLSPEPPPWDDGVGTRVEPGPLVEIDPGRYLLTYDVAWKHGRVGWDSEGTLETARFAFPIEIVDEGASVVDAVEAAAAPILGSLPPRSFDGPTLHGKALDPADFDDRAIIAVAWSPSCVSCNRVLGRIQNALVSSRLFPSVIGVVPRSDRARAIEVEEVLSLTFESVLARASLLEGVTFPSTWIMRPDGTVVAIQVGHVDEAWLAGAIADATFGEPEPTLEGPAGTDPASSSESTSIPDVLRVRCTADGAQVLTPNVETSDDGVRVIATPGSAQHADAIEIRPLGWPIFNVSSGSSGIDGEFVRPVPEGDVIVGCYREKVEYAS